MKHFSSPQNDHIWIFFMGFITWQKLDFYGDVLEALFCRVCLPLLKENTVFCDAIDLWSLTTKYSCCEYLVNVNEF